MKLTKSKLLEIIEQELDEGFLTTAALAGMLSFSTAFVKAYDVVQRAKANPNIGYTVPKGIDSDTVSALIKLRNMGQLENVDALRRLDQRTRTDLEVPDEFKK
jgi:hypothetical protein